MVLAAFRTIAHAAVALAPDARDERRESTASEAMITDIDEIDAVIASSWIRAQRDRGQVRRTI